MESVHVERLDHLGLIACMIKDVGLISLIDARLVPDEQEEITPGEAVAGMILHGLGFPIARCRSPPSFLPTNRSICCFVPVFERRCSIALRWAGRSMKSRPMGVIYCSRSWLWPAGPRTALITRSM